MRQYERSRRLIGWCCGAIAAGVVALAPENTESISPARAQDTAPAVAVVVDPVASEALAQRVNEQLGLVTSTIAVLDIGGDASVELSIPVPLHGETVTLDLTPQSAQATDYQVLVQNPDGTYEAVEPQPVRTLRGTVQGIDGSAVAATLLAEGLYARIILSDEDEYWVEPIGSRIAGAADGQHVVYHGSDIIPSGKSCGADALSHTGWPAGGDDGLRGSCGGSVLCLAELACDTDYEYYQDWGSVSAVENRINTVVNTVNIQYERDVDITHEITTIIVRSSASDPYTTSNPEALLDQFRNHWESTHGSIRRDLAQMFTGRNLSGTTIGIAWMASTCTSFAYSLVESDCCGSLGCATDLSAHEMGHSWGADHCNCYGWTMHPSLTCANRFHATLSIPDIVSYRTYIQFCLDPLGSGDITPPTPNPMTFSTEPWAFSPNEMRMTAALATDPVSPPVEYQFDFTSGGSGGSDSLWQSSRTYADTGLSPNAAYTYRVRAQDSATPPNATGYSGAVTAYTLANVPAAPSLTGVDCDEMDIDVAPNGNPATTGFAIRCSSTSPIDPNWNGMYVSSSGTPVALAQWRTDSQWGTTRLNGMQENTVYSFRVKARNEDLIETAEGAAASLTTGDCGAGVCDTSAACPNADVNCDDIADGFDIAVIRNVGNWLHAPGDADEPRADVNGDGIIDGFDVAVVRSVACWLR